MTATASAAKTQLLIGKDWVDAQGGALYTDTNPATSAQLAEVADASAADVDRAVRAARTAFESGKWATMTASRRAKIIYKMAQLIAERAGELALLEVRDNGKTLATAKGELSAIVDCFEFYAGAATKNYGSTLPAPVPGYLAYTVREPVGVVGAIIPWNFPLLLASWKVAPALAAGCTIVLKPAPSTPLTAIELGRIALEAGLPEGVLNVLTGGGPQLGQQMVEHPDIDKIAFTGSTVTGKRVAATAAQTLKRVTLELGGKSPSLVFDDADLGQAVNGALYGIFYNAGQTCEARSRVLLHDRIADDFIAAFSEKAKRLRVGDPEDPQTHIGAITMREQLEKIQEYCSIAQGEGATKLFGGEPPELGPQHERGWFWSATAYEGEPSHRVAREEIFGPVVTFVRFKDEAQAVAMANDTEYGLSASIWSQNVGRVNRVARALRSGTVAINTPYAVFPGVPFGGYKQSGYGRELGMETMALYSETKSVLTYTGEKPIDPFGV
ncbi:MAG TPA: aldehyde dehydrogenase family protein [Candidatus Baltobacteraceae bacterium]|jgi:acyl-CoA reductase-like NAD-dependent aldehyde dehydrogenase|nr:aldehyde dehydrogenase family protein [Candidatus Baltobacteraceae bacterium]